MSSSTAPASLALNPAPAASCGAANAPETFRSSRTAIFTLLRKTKRCSASTSGAGSASGSTSHTVSSSMRNSANSAITRPFGVSQPFHCQWPDAIALTSFMNCACAKATASRPARLITRWSDKAKFGPEAACGLSCMGAGLKLQRCDDRRNHPDTPSRRRARRRPRRRFPSRRRWTRPARNSVAGMARSPPGTATGKRTAAASISDRCPSSKAPSAHPRHAAQPPSRDSHHSWRTANVPEKDPFHRICRSTAGRCRW